MGTSKFFKYFLYAIGEVVLIVIGINVALHFDNQNKVEQTQEELFKVYDIISHDLELETASIASYVNMIEQYRPVYDATLAKEVTQEMIASDSKFSRPAIITTSNLKFYDRGYQMLISNAEFNTVHNDSIHGNIMEYYNYAIELVKGVTMKLIESDAQSNIDHWKFNYDWFHNMQTNPAFFDYVQNDPEYLNMVRKHQFLIYYNLLPHIKRLKEDATNILAGIELIKKNQNK